MMDKVFRIFVSSTFSDMKAEREALQTFVFPRLRELCVQHGCRFQAVDLRWGVSEEAARHQPIRICLDEVARCRRVTSRPNLVVLLGDRYGARPIPYEIPASEFEEIERRVTSADDRALLQTWYRRDDNAIPPIHVVETRTGEFTDPGRWREIENRLRGILLRAVESMPLTDDERLKYVSSATEQEIVEGALRTPGMPGHVFGYFRSIRDLAPSAAAADFVDLTEDGWLDPEANQRLDDLKARLLSKFPGSITECAAAWADDGITHDHLGSLPDDLDACLRLLDDPLGDPLGDPDAANTLCVSAWRHLARVILEEIAGVVAVDPLDREIADHETFGAERSRFFTGRTAIRQTISDYLRGDNPQPLVVVGPSGSGKSALMAYAASQVRTSAADARLVVRFIGATPASSDGRTLLDSLCRQISRLYGADTSALPMEFKGLMEELPRRLALATAREPLLLFLDALDQFSESDPARLLNWLPCNLPAHVRVVVSLTPGAREIDLKQRLPAESVVVLDPLLTAEAEDLLDLWLADARRTLQTEQRSEVIEKFNANGLPLYLRLAFEEARGWPSYADSRLTRLSDDIPGIIRNNLFARLSDEANHGALFVSRSLTYLVAARNGLTEDELLDVLSRDADVLADFHRRSPRSPTVERLPVVVWSRLFFDLEPYLMEQSADGASLMTFYHRQLRDVVADVYLRGDGTARHRALAGYFDSQALLAPRTRAPNVRKLSELPYQQTRGELWEELYETLTDFDFLEAKCSHVAVSVERKGAEERKVYGGVYELQEDYRRAPTRWPDLAVIEHAVQLAAHAVAQDSAQLAGQLLGRMERAEGASTSRLFRQAEAWRGAPWLRLLLGNLNGAGGPLVRTIASSLSTNRTLAVTPAGSLGIENNFRTATLWDLHRGIPLRDITVDGAIAALALPAAGDPAFIATTNGTLIAWRNDGWTRLIWAFRRGIPVNVTVFAPDARRALCWLPGPPARLLLIDLDTGKLLRVMEAYPHSEYYPALAIAPDGGTAVAIAKGSMQVWDLRTGTRRSELSLIQDGEFRPFAVALTHDGSQTVVGSAEGEMVFVDLSRGVVRHRVRSHRSRVDVAVTPDGRRAVSLSGGELMMWTLEDCSHSGSVKTAGDKVVLTSDGSGAVTSSPNGLQIWRLDRTADRSERDGIEPSDRVKTLRQLLGDDALTRLLDVVKGWDTERRLQAPALGKYAGVLRVLPHAGLVVAGVNDGWVKVWNPDCTEVIRTWEAHSPEPVTALAVTSDGALAVSGSYEDETLKLWDLNTGRHLRTLEGYASRWTSAAITPDGRWVAAGSSGPEVCVWDLTAGTPPRVFKGHSAVVADVELTADGSHVRSGSFDGTFRIWDIERGAGVATFTFDDPVSRCAHIGGGDAFVCLHRSDALSIVKLFGAPDPASP